MIGCFEKDLKQAFLFIDTFFQTEAREWNLIDKLRLDKFMMVGALDHFHLSVQMNALTRWHCARTGKIKL